MENDIYVTGCTNVIRLTGNVDGMDKMITIIISENMNEKQQHAQCNYPYTYTLNKYFIKELGQKNSETPVDIFTDRIMELLTLKDRFIDKIFDKIQNKYPSNIRIHHSIYYYEFYDLLIANVGVMHKNVNRMFTDYNNMVESIGIIQNRLKLVSISITKLLGWMENYKDNHFVNKMFKKIKNSNLKKIISLAESNIIVRLKTHIRKIKEYENMIDELDKVSDIEILKCDQDVGCYYEYDSITLIRKFLVKLANNINNLNDDIIFTISMLNMLHCLRRLIDKKNINKMIFVTRDDIAIRIIQILVNDFNFNLTYTAYTNLSYDELNNKIKENKKLNPYERFRYEKSFDENILPEMQNNCTKISKDIRLL